MLRLHVFLDEKCSKFAVHFLRKFGGSIGIAHLESHEFSRMAGHFYEVNPNVVAHLFDRIARLQQPAQAGRPGIEMKMVDRGLKTSAAKNLFRHTPQTL